MKSKLHILVALFGWIIFIAYVFYDYHEHGSDILRHFFIPNDISETAFHLIILITPFGSSITAYLINERKKLFTKAQQSEKKYRTLMEYASDAIFIADLESGTILDVNKKAAELLGMPAEKIIGINQSQLHPEEEAEYYKEIFRSHIQKGEGFESNIFIQRKDGYKVPVEISANVIEIQGEKVIQGIFRDVTERKRAEGIMLQEKQKLEDVTSYVNCGLFLLDDQTRVIYANKVSELWFGSFHKIRGKPCWEIFGMKNPEKECSCLKVLRTGETVRSEAFVKSVDGQDKYFYVVASPVKNIEGKTFQVTEVVIDITERKRSEEMIQLQLKRINALHSIEKAITASLDIRVTLDILLDQVITQLKIDAATVLLLNPKTKLLQYINSKGFRTSALKYTQLKLGESNAGRAAIERRVITIANLKENLDGFERSKPFKDEDFITYFAIPLIAKGEVKGILELFNRVPLNPEPEWLEFAETIADQAAIAIDNVTLFDGLQRSNIELVLAYDTTIEGWSRAMDMRDKETEGHTQRVTEMTLSIAQEMGIKEEEFVHIRRGALLHDMGKLGVPDNILFKPGPLTDEEWGIMKRHPQLAYEMLHPIEYLRLALDIPYCHHEKWDGTGYPRGLKGEEIPLAARIFAVVDVWDALNSDRPYRPAWPREKVREHICSLSGTHFEPNVAEVFLKMEL